MPSDEIRNRILNEATAMFLREGFQKTNLDTLSQMLFVSKRTVYKIFGSKKGLYRECIKRIITNVEYEDELNIRKNEESINNIRDFIESHSSGELLLMEQALNDLNKYFPDIYEECLKSSEQKRMARLVEQIKEGQRNGDIYPSVNPEIVAIIIQQMIKNRITPNDGNSNSNPNIYLRSEIFTELMRIFLRGLLSEKKIQEYDDNIT